MILRLKTKLEAERKNMSNDKNNTDIGESIADLIGESIAIWGFFAHSQVQKARRECEE